MCTVTIIPLEAGLRLVTNRDEERERPQADAPRWRTLRGDPPRSAVWPRDPTGGGTWVGANDAGLVLTLLNVNPQPPVPPDEITNPLSRGVIIPALAEQPRAHRAMDALQRLELDRFMPFRLVAAERDPEDGTTRVIDAVWDRKALRFESRLDTPSCFVSSGLGDRLVEPRHALFAELVGGGATAEAQDRFHAHAWPDRPELSVMMSRADARTVSVTTVEVTFDESGAAGVNLDYRPVPDAIHAAR